MIHFTKFGYRYREIASNEGNFNWLFLPGGPGLGSEYLENFCEMLDVKGKKYLVDFPMDGINQAGKLSIDAWKAGLIDLCRQFESVILVTHSFSGMFSLSLPELEAHLRGLILMNTTDQNSFFAHITKMQQEHGLPDLLPAINEYHRNPSKEGFRKYWELYKNYCYAEDEMAKGEEMIKLFAFNNDSYNFAIEEFYMSYQSKWIPNLVSTLTIGGTNDYICPYDIFIMNQKYCRPNIINRVIVGAGHCPWINHFSEIQACFDEFTS
jgi:pimeloyl-ACP methyl ester carboxylesterase